MKKELHFTIDKITNSIEEVLSGTSFDTEVGQVTKEEIRSVHKKTAGFLIGNRSIRKPAAQSIS